MGAAVFYRSRDHQIVALSRDGDIIHHTVGDNIITVNGEQKVFENPSVLENYETYIPIDMVSAAFCPDRISYDNQQLNIQKQFSNNDYNKVVKDVLDVCRSSNFYAERFQRYINYHVKMPACSMQEVLFRVNLGLDYPFYENVTTIEQPYELLVLVNKYFRLPSGFNQYNLVNMSSKYTVNDGKQYLLAGVAYEKYIQMFDAAKKDGLSLRVISAYRTEDYQRGLYNNKVRTTGKVNADNYSARPGHSEHQTGLAVDICSTKGTFEYTSEFKWLQNHAHEYGFILRYPKGKEWITGYSYEPWHYRYVGTDAAKIIYEEGITYEEYYAKYISVNEFR
jgi:D-alanyl-D-alanine carboxypeptidase